MKIYLLLLQWVPVSVQTEKKVSTKRKKICKKRNYPFQVFITDCIICIDMIVSQLCLCNMIRVKLPCKSTEQPNLDRPSSLSCQQPTLPTLCFMWSSKADWCVPTQKLPEGRRNQRAAGEVEQCWALLATIIHVFPPENLTINAMITSAVWLSYVHVNSIWLLTTLSPVSTLIPDTQETRSKYLFTTVQCPAMLN